MTRTNRTRCVLAAGLLATFAAFPPPARAAAPDEVTTPVRELLLASRDPDDLRARLRAFADSAGDASLDAGEAWLRLGDSWARAGEIDRALEAYGRARAVTNGPEEILDLVDLRLARRASGDLDSAAALLAPLRGGGGGLADRVLVRDGWLRALRGDAVALGAVLAPRRSPLFRPRSPLRDRPLWAMRFAPLAIAAGEGQAGWDLVAPLAVATRGRDPEIRRLARDASAGRLPGTTFDDWLAAACAHADSAILAVPRALGAKPLAVDAGDGTTLPGWFVPGAVGAPLAVVALPVDDEAAVACDSLFVQLHRAGIAQVLFEPRGVRGAIGPSAPPALLRPSGDGTAERQLALDYARVLAAGARAAKSRAPRGVMVGVAGDAMAAVLGAAAEPRAAAVLLVGPVIAPVDRGWLRATIGDAGLPVFFETGPEDLLENLVVDRIVAALPPALTRVADARVPGHGAALFRAGPAEGARFAGWLSDLPKRPRATPPPPRR